MNKNILALLFLLLSTGIVYNTALAQNSLGLSVGSKLTYEVTNSNNARYNLKLTVKSMDTNGVTFDWAANNKKGSLTLSGEALENAATLNSEFKAGMLKLQNQLSVFFPKKAFRELSGGQTSVKLDKEASATTFKKVMTRRYDYYHDGEMKTVQVVLGAKETQEKGKTRIVLVLDDANFPLLVALDWQVRMTLKSIETI
ncbi:MAG: hypothetical protein HC817_13130 [Saprospiraceae bacterium]|nr:hypothetical protein [Saprospiraceae bacterium]